MKLNRYLIFFLIIIVGCESGNIDENSKKVDFIKDTVGDIRLDTTETKVKPYDKIDSIKIIGDKIKEQTIEASKSLPKVKHPNADTIFPDTIEIKDYRLIISKIDEDEFLKYTSKQNLTKYPSSGLSRIEENFNKKAWRENDSTIMIELESGLIDTIYNYYSEGLTFSKYYYLDYIDEIKSHLLAGKFYEADNYVLVYDSTGNIDEGLLSSNISIDSTRNRLISYAWDDFVYESGGFKIFDISKGQMNLILNYNQINSDGSGFYWSLSDVHYLSPDKLVYTHQLYFTKGSKYEKFYAIMNIEKTTSN